MNNFPFTQNFEKMADFSQQGFEPVRQFAGVAAEALESVARQNYAVCGDVLEFAVSQARLPVNVTDPKALFEHQVTATKAFADLMGARINEYVELGQDLQASVAEQWSPEVAVPAKKTSRTRKKAA